MIRNAKFWVPMILFQVAFGLMVFALNRDDDFYGPDRTEAQRSAVDPGAPKRPSDFSGRDLAGDGRGAASSIGAALEDPVEISRQADEYFANQQYEEAADFYARLLPFEQNTVDTHNNLGLTLHYLNRSTEALRTLNEGVAIDPKNQRIWLTLGYVNQQLGNREAAQKALTMATVVGDDDAIRKSAMGMLRDLP